MKLSDVSLRTVFAKNRTEELGMDVWLHFVVPLFFDRLDLGTARKPRLFVGGRGCGKTMLLRYLSHQSAFSLDRKLIPASAINHIGLYWRVDTQFVVIMNERGLPADTWHSAFNHLLALFLGLEILGSLKNIGRSKFPSTKPLALENINFDRLSVFDPSFTGGLDELSRTLESKIWEFESWVANVRKSQEPRFLPGARFLSAVIAHIKSVVPCLSGAQYFVYVDEFENLLTYQQQILNTYVKHSESPLIFNLAMKRHAFETFHTVGIESIQGIADFRTHDLDTYLLENNFPLFAAEVLFLNLAMAKVEGVPIDVQALRDSDRIQERRVDSYQRKVLGQIREIFPGLTQAELAMQVFANEALSRKLLDRVENAIKLRQVELPTAKLFRPTQAQATIIIPALLHRKKLAPEEIAEELALLEAGIVGQAVDDRGSAAEGFARENSECVHLFSYSPETLNVSLDSVRFSAESVDGALAKMAKTRILVEATTLGFVEILLCCRALKQLGVPGISLAYIEPASYFRPHQSLIVHRRDFELSDEVDNFSAVPGNAVLMRSDRTKVILFLGFEGQRMNRFLEQTAISPSACSITFGVPAFRPGWEMHAFANNFIALRGSEMAGKIQFCGAQNPLSAYAAVKRIYDSCAPNERLVIVPVGTKPHGIGAALFASEHPETGVSYDNPKRKDKRSESVGAWHLFDVVF